MARKEQDQEVQNQKIIAIAANAWVELCKKFFAEESHDERRKIGMRMAIIVGIGAEATMSANLKDDFQEIKESLQQKPQDD